jgi:hypothetical protein
MAKKNAVNLAQHRANLKRALKELEEKEKIVSKVLKHDLPVAKTTVYGHMETLASQSVAEDYQATLLHVAYTCGEKGVRLPILRKVLLDQVDLDDARKELGSLPYKVADGENTIELNGKGYLTEKTDGNSVVIHITEAGKAAFVAAQG